MVANMLGGAELVEITTSGDRVRAAGDKSRFVKEIEDALLRGEVDLAVHSAKDVPGELPDGLEIAGVPARADPRDALCGADSLDDLAEGARVGTASVRRRSQLLALRPDLEVVELRGNVDTRLRRLADGDYDAIVLAAAGLERLGRAGEGAPIPVELMTPAPGQGCLALEVRSGNDSARKAVAALTDPVSWACLAAERDCVAVLEATCDTPVGVLAEAVDGDARELRVSAYAGAPDGSVWVRDVVDGAGNGVGREVAERLLTAGARAILTS
jgi:hydroxymethylbilane synthase